MLHLEDWHNRLIGGLWNAPMSSDMPNVGLCSEASSFSHNVSHKGPKLCGFSTLEYKILVLPPAHLRRPGPLVAGKNFVSSPHQQHPKQQDQVSHDPYFDHAASYWDFSQQEAVFLNL